MSIRTILTWLGLSAMTAALVAGAPPVPAPSTAAPGPRLRPKIGAAPRSNFQTAGHQYNIDSNQPGVAAVRSMPPKSFEPPVRNRSVNAFYREQLAKDSLSKDKLDRLIVGPFRHEFVWWALHHWGLRDRAWWAWNNYAYFDTALWREWMLDQDFKQLIAQFDAMHKARQLGFIPDAYAGQPAEIIYNDDYIDAVYNPTPTPPSIVVDSTASVQLSNLLEGTPRLFGKKTIAIGNLNDRVRRYQFISLPTGFDPTYQIEVKRDCDIYVFGPAITTPNDAFGPDAAKWIPITNQVNGQGIQVVYRRQVKTGEQIHLHGVEWSIASEQIELFSPASEQAQAASRHIVRDLQQMTVNKGNFVQKYTSLADYVQEAHDVAAQLVTANNNVNDDAVADCRYELANLQKMSEADLNQSADVQLIAAGKDFVGRIQSLQASLNEVDELHDPNAVDPMPNLAPGAGVAAEKGTVAEKGTGTVSGVGLDAPGSSTISLWDWRNPDNGAGGTLNFNDDGTCVVIRCLKDDASETAGHWKQNGDSIVITGPGGETIWKTLPNGQMSRIDRGTVTKVEATKRAWGDLGENRIKVISATFGNAGHEADLTQRITELYDRHQDIVVNVSVLGADPDHGFKKSLSIEYTVDGEKKSTKCGEGKVLRWRDLAG